VSILKPCFPLNTTLPEESVIMKKTHGLKVGSLILAATLFAGPGFIVHAAAQERSSRSYLIDLNSRTATNLGTLGGDTFANGVNNAGQVVGLSMTPIGDWRAFVTGPDGAGIRKLDALSEVQSEASDINDSGQIVGNADLFSGKSYAFITGPNGMGVRDLGTLGGHYSGASAINAGGQVVGTSLTANGQYHAFITGPAGVGMRDLGSLTPSSSYSHATDINAAGQVVGDSLLIGDNHPFITGPNGTGMRDIGTLGGDTILQNFHAALGINDAGQVVGYSVPSGTHWPSERSHAFITGPNGAGIRDLGTLHDYDISGAYAINNSGQVVGDSVRRFCDLCGVPDIPHAFITGPDGVGMTDLNSLVDLPEGVILTGARDINDAGQVIATAIPELQAYPMFLAGLGLIAFTTRRKWRTV
jgi:probable HAF family extracellular repeat protein